MRSVVILSTLVVSLTIASSTARAQEICGDGVDNDSDNLADEGCNPAAVTGVHESPLPSGATGIVAPKSGQLVWTEPPDITPTVAYGPPIDFQRTYLSLFDSGYNDPAATDYRAPMGY